MKKLAVFTIILLMTCPVFAQQPASRATNSSPMEARVDQRIATMKQDLKITPAQEQAWDGFAQTMRDNAASVEKAYEERTAKVKTMSAPENMRNFAQVEKVRGDGVQNLATKFQTLYDGLSNQQKATADTMFRNFEERRSARRQAPK